MQLLAISGSLRAHSSNTALVHAVARVLPDGVTFRIFGGLALLPAYNPDLDVDPALPPVAEWRAEITGADAVLISSPEYAHGIPGVLKNALDWTVASGEFVNKPVAIVNASAHSQFVLDQLRETLTVLSARVVVAEALPLTFRPADASELLADDAASTVLRAAVASLVDSATPD
ncbi:MAG: NAD(P)H-dependent oxidoreductase [Gemmatimonadota bacterium]|nr:NAD(P)H-dependent oxidoreductase [Gemmatimonadota bacterium]